MHLNHRYFHHQIPRFRASGAGSAKLYSGHKAQAGGFTAVMKAFQRSVNAPTAPAWSVAL